MKNAQLPFPVMFQILTSAPWNDDAVARSISYEYMVVRAEIQVAHATDFLLRCLNLLRREPDDESKFALLASLNKKVPALIKKFEEEGPHDFYLELIDLMRDWKMTSCVMRLAEFGTHIALLEAHPSREIFFRALPQILPRHIKTETAPDFLKVMDRLNWLISSNPTLATTAYVAFCCELLKFPLVKPKAVTTFTAPHEKPKIAQEVRNADAAASIHREADNNLQTVLQTIKSGRRMASDIDILFDKDNWMTLAILSNSSMDTKHKAAALTKDIEEIRNRQLMGFGPNFPSAYLQIVHLRDAQTGAKSAPR